ncbi:glycosyl hydrolase [Mycena galopus ATCC 62051]|nr:glycosyl hydrolase [Mycena galopus ATCC 62051]
MRFVSPLAGALALFPWASAFTNPPIYEDLADVDLRRYNDTYYLSTSTMHFSPGAPILRSFDLVNWEYIGHSVPQLAQFGTGYTLPPGQNAYIEGVWASWLIFVPAQNKWFWGGCINFFQTHIFSSAGPDPTSAWTQISVINACYYDSGAFMDDDGTVYVSFKDLGTNTFGISKMSADMTTPVQTQVVVTLPANNTSLEGTRPYKINGTYYIFTSSPNTGGEYVYKSSDIFSTSWEVNVFLGPDVAPQAPLVCCLGQGALVETQNGVWYWMGFSWSYPNGRIPVLFPITWSSDGWPIPTLANGALAASYPDTLTPQPVTNNLTGVDTFAGTSLGVQWEWNHDPDATNFTVNNGLMLRTASLTNDWFAARNTLTHRQLGPISTATIKMTVSSMKDGDRAGLGLFRDVSAYIGVWRSGNTYTVNMVNNITMNTSWVTTNTGDTAASVAVTGTTIWFRVISDSTPAVNLGTFWYSTDGKTFKQLGPGFSTDTNFQYFEGQRFAIFNFAASSLGGSVQVANFELAAGSYTGVAVGA